MTTLDDLAPYPKTLKGVTADGLARNLTVHAHADAMRSQALHRLMRQAEGTGTEVEAADRYQLNVSAYTAEHGVAFALRALIKIAPGKADDVAREIWRQWDNPPIGEHTWVALEAYGIDPGAVEDVLRASEADTAGAAK